MRVFCRSPQRNACISAPAPPSRRSGRRSQGNFDMANVAWLGLGVMGYPMAGHLKVRGGHDVTVYNRSPAKAAKWETEFGGKTAPTPAEAARDCDAVFACVGNDDDLRSITVGPGGAFETMREGALFIDHTTTSARVARELAAAAQRARAIVSRLPGVGRPGRRRGRNIDGHGGRRRSRISARRTADQKFRAQHPPHGARGLGPAREDGQPDRDRRRRSRPRRGHSLRGVCRPRHRSADRDDLEGRGAILADGEPLADHARAGIQFRLRRRLDAQGSWHLPRRGGDRMAPICPQRASSTISTRRCRLWAAAAGTHRALSPASGASPAADAELRQASGRSALLGLAGRANCRGRAVVYLICSMAKADDTLAMSMREISFL